MRAQTTSFLRRVLIPALSLASFGGSCLWAAQTNVLIYYSPDCIMGSTEPMTAATAILTAEGAQVTSIPISTTGYCPTADNWGAYNQVWDMRMTDPASPACPDTTPSEDLFTACWQSQAVAYLESGGDLYLTGEFDQWNSRAYGVSDFIITVGGVKAGYTDCPGTNGNGLDPTEALFPATFPGQSGPVSFLGGYVGGIPLPLLNGFNFVTDPVAGDWNDGVNRSIASGWEGSLGQMASLTGNVGNLAVVWDCNYLSQPMFSGVTQVENTLFVQNVYCFLGGGGCAATTPTPTPTPSLTPTPTSTLTFTPTPSPSPTFSPTFTATFTPTSSYTPTPSFTPTFTPTPTVTVTLTQTPTPTYSPTPACAIHLWPDPYSPGTAWKGLLRIGCLPENAKVFLYTVSGELVLQMAPDMPDTANFDGWVAEWDGRNRFGAPTASGIYFYVVQTGNQVLQTGKFLKD